MKRSRGQATRELAAKWRQWTDVVGLFAGHQGKRVHVGAEEYRALYADLSRLCREQADGDVQVDPEVLGQCRELLGPWVTPDALQWAERDIIRDLWNRSRQTERLLAGRSTRSSGGGRAVWLVGGGMAAAAFLAALWSGNGAQAPSPLQAARGWLRSAERLIASGSLDQSLLIGGAVLALIAGIFVWRSARGW
jgi:hypothetical protein